jgi:hypothetical protein
MDRSGDHGSLSGGQETATARRDCQKNAGTQKEKHQTGDEVEHFYYMDIKANEKESFDLLCSLQRGPYSFRMGLAIVL